ncbi:MULTISPECIES: hypothetical protein [Clostridium]|jgi:hypothetical protein|uniref:hypothetical protein n=1 Tax=Clostridium TaxID=1485 RepID=UPI00257ED5C6|nr:MULTISPECIES: hypothetical protein [Clostridium]WRY50334.1 hypothetical protein P8F83_16825 [Clostridium intestinale]
MSWDKIREMNLFDKLKDEVKNIPSVDSSKIEEYITDPEKLQTFKDYIHQGYDSRSLGEEMGLTTNQVEIIKELLGKL